MRIISGTLKGRVIKSLKGMAIRPTSDRVKEAYFNIIGQYFDDVRVLDMFCGTGGIGFEFLSRGAGSVSFVDNSRESISIARENARSLNIMEKCHFYTMDASDFLMKYQSDAFNYIYVDPPYREIVTNSVLSLIGENILKPDGILTLEHSIKVKYPDKSGSLYLFRQRRFGDTVLSFYSFDANIFEEKI